MRIKVPITGTVINIDSASGDPNDPIRLINIDLGNVSWELIELDLVNDLADIEVTPGEATDEATDSFDAEGKPIYRTRPTTQAERLQYLNDLKKVIDQHTKEELYEMSKSARLKKPFKG